MACGPFPTAFLTLDQGAVDEPLRRFLRDCDALRERRQCLVELLLCSQTCGSLGNRARTLQRRTHGAIARRCVANGRAFDQGAFASGKPALHGASVMVLSHAWNLSLIH